MPSHVSQWLDKGKSQRTQGNSNILQHPNHPNWEFPSEHMWGIPKVYTGKFQNMQWESPM